MAKKSEEAARGAEKKKVEPDGDYSPTVPPGKAAKESSDSSQSCQKKKKKKKKGLKVVGTKSYEVIFKDTGMDPDPRIRKKIARHEEERQEFIERAFQWQQWDVIDCRAGASFRGEPEDAAGGPCGARRTLRTGHEAHGAADAHPCRGDHGEEDRVESRWTALFSANTFGRGFLL